MCSGDGDGHILGGVESGAADEDGEGELDVRCRIFVFLMLFNLFLFSSCQCWGFLFCEQGIHQDPPTACVWRSFLNGSTPSPAAVSRRAKGCLRQRGRAGDLCTLDDEAVSHGYRRGMVWAVELAELRGPSGPERPLPRLQRDTHRRPRQLRP